MDGMPASSATVDDSAVELPVDPTTPISRPLVWQQTSRTSWRSEDGEYLIVAQTSPDRSGDLVAYQLRGTDIGGYGYHIDETYDLRQTMAVAVRHRFCSENHRDRSVPADLTEVTYTVLDDVPSGSPGELVEVDVAGRVENLERFFWPASEGTSRGAVAVTVDPDGTRRVSVVGMVRSEPDVDGVCRFSPVVYVTLPLPRT